MITEHVPASKKPENCSPLRILCYAASAVLLLFYIAVLLKSLDISDMPQDYRDYYVDHRYVCAVPSVREKYGANERYDYVSGGTYFNQGAGWYQPEETGTWTKGAESVIYFYLDEVKGDYELMLDVNWHVFQYTNELYVNGNKVDTFNAYENGMFTFLIPEGCLTAGENEFTIRAVEEVNPLPSDPRTLNLFVSSVELREV